MKMKSMQNFCSYVTCVYAISFFSDGAQNVVVSGTVLLMYWIIKAVIT